MGCGDVGGRRIDLNFGATSERWEGGLSLSDIGEFYARAIVETGYGERQFGAFFGTCS